MDAITNAGGKNGNLDKLSNYMDRSSFFICEAINFQYLFGKQIQHPLTHPYQCLERKLEVAQNSQPYLNWDAMSAILKAEAETRARLNNALERGEGHPAP